GGSLTGSVGVGDVVFTLSSAMHAAGRIDWRVGHGDIRFADLSEMQSAAALGLAIGQGNLSFVDRSALTSALGATLAIGEGDAVFARNSHWESGGRLDGTVGVGDLTFVDDATLRSVGSLRWATGRGDVAFVNRSSLVSDDSLLLTVGEGDVGFTDVSGLASPGVVVLRIGEGNLSFLRTAGLASGVMVDAEIGVGDIAFVDQAILTAPGPVALTVGQGDVAFVSHGRLVSESSVALRVGEGDVTFSDWSVMEAPESVELVVGSGDVAFVDQTRLVAEDRLRVSIAAGSVLLDRDVLWQAGEVTVGIRDAGDFVARQNTLIHAVEQGDLRVAGAVVFVDNARMVAGDVLTMLHSGGDFRMADTATLWAGEEATLDLGVHGTVTLTDRATITVGSLIDSGLLTARMGGDVRLANESFIDLFHGVAHIQVTEGDFRLSDAAFIRAERLDMVVEVGDLTMDDAETLLIAGDTLTLSVGGNILLDELVAGKRIELTSTDGAIHDNTAGEEDLIVTKVLRMEAAQGIGLPWEDNEDIDVAIEELGAKNHRSGGIAVYTDGGFRVGNVGVTGQGDRDVVLVARDAILYSYVGFVTDGDSSDHPSQVVSRHGPGAFVINQLPLGAEVGEGNLSTELLSLMTMPHIVLDTFDFAAEAISTVTESEEGGEEGGSQEERRQEVANLVSRPIRMASGYDDGGTSIFRRLGLSEEGEGMAQMGRHLAELRSRLFGGGEHGEAGRQSRVERLLSDLSVGSTADVFAQVGALDSRMGDSIGQLQSLLGIDLRGGAGAGYSPGGLGGAGGM
ncbi:MAG: hypothetical protein HQL59_13875, partial [Magnetococcales bacterium]|nr:hypothetical protein [Magnetococcales bacterium]